MRDFARWLADLWHTAWMSYHANTLDAAWRNHRTVCSHALERYTHHRLRLAELEAL